ncbi:riboflavin synthase [Lacihabitans soyangensis]|uniref:Riboflavin synthase n=1 Tax=Lacihabitans soyangensis TaxID=869394 RepID=A0AAE3KXA2_9BACT|nr:riboflavin synthase [Lacihabitans soyangensis]MCP9764425.1 riboflavin synthase [Lacihabitans soyangensis]
MFTGIVESKAQLVEINPNQSNLSFVFESDLTNEFKVDQSVSHNGVCLTIEKIDGKRYQVTAIEETLIKTNLGKLKVGDSANLERSMKANARFDGHIVQGHVDQIGICKKITDLNGSWQIDIEYDGSVGNITVEKGSICLNGISLTVFNSKENGFSVAIIPFTWTHTNMHAMKEGDTVNLEFDIVGKYLAKLHKPFIGKM